MTASEARAIADDVDATITRWRTRGVLAADIGADLRCHRSWPSIRAEMTRLLLLYEGEAAELRRAA